MKILLIDNGTSLLDKLQKLAGMQVSTKKWNEVSLADADSSDLVILSGSSQYSVTRNHDQFTAEVELIKSNKAPVIGICFGCELIAYAFGGTLGELKEKEHGIKEISLLEAGLTSKATVNVYESHMCVIASMPDSFSVVAKSDDGPEIIRHNSLPIYGLQFHPENFVDETDGDEIFSRIVKLATKSI